MDDIKKAKKHYFEVAKGMGYIPATDKELEFEYEAKILSYGGPTTQYPQVRVWSEMSDETEVTVWTMVNSACSVPKGKATLKADTSRVEIAWCEYSEDGSCNMSADLLELKYHFKNLPGADCFDYVMISVAPGILGLEE
jgi:hypothetical protein